MYSYAYAYVQILLYACNVYLYTQFKILMHHLPVILHGQFKKVFRVMKHTATHCNTLQHTATHGAYTCVDQVMKHISVPLHV